MEDTQGREELIQKFQAQQNGTASPEYPDGKLNKDDEGELAIKIGVSAKHQQVIVDFSKPTNWIAMPPQNAVDLAMAIINQARVISQTPLTIQFPSGK